MLSLWPYQRPRLHRLCPEVFTRLERPRRLHNLDGYSSLHNHAAYGYQRQANLRAARCYAYTCIDVRKCSSQLARHVAVCSHAMSLEANCCTHLWIRGRAHALRAVSTLRILCGRDSPFWSRNDTALCESHHHHHPAGPATQLVKFCAGHVTGHRTSDQRKCSRYEWEMSPGLGLSRVICIPHGHPPCIITLRSPNKAPLSAVRSILDIAVHDHAAAHLTYIYGITHWSLLLR